MTSPGEGTLAWGTYMAPLLCTAGTTLMEVGGQLVQALHVGFAAEMYECCLH